MGAVNSLHAVSHLVLFCFIYLHSITHDMHSDKWSHHGLNDESDKVLALLRGAFQI